MKMFMGMSSRRSLARGSTILILLSSVLLVSMVAADGGLNLPLIPVKIEVFDGTGSYFDTKLMEVPSGYDVGNATYPGWCVDASAVMTRSPATHIVRLYSSVSPPGDLASEKWDIVNYILNHKQGTAQDVQQAIWYFIHMDGSYTPTSSVAWVIVNDAEANGNGFVPGSGQTIAVICYPVILFPDQPDVQISIIEITAPVIPEFPSLLIPSVFMLTMLLMVAIRKGARTSQSRRTR